MLFHFQVVWILIKLIEPYLSVTIMTDGDLFRIQVKIDLVIFGDYYSLLFPPPIVHFILFWGRIFYLVFGNLFFHLKFKSYAGYCTSQHQ